MSSFISSPNYPHSPNVTRLQADALRGYCLNCEEAYGQQLEGFFVPKATALHQFYIASDDASELWLSGSNQPSNMTLIASCPNFLPTYWTSMSTQISKPMMLFAGQPYFIRVRHAQGTGWDFVNVAVRIFNPPTRSAADIRRHSVAERQKLSITSAVAREIQQVNFTDASGQFRFYMDVMGARSAYVQLASSSEVQVKNAIEVCTIFCYFCI
jgi:hypothetical protein